MDQEAFYKIVANPDDVIHGEGIQWLEILSKYPYFHSAHLLYQKYLEVNCSPDREQRLPYSATHVVSRKRLFQLLYTPRPLEDLSILNPSPVTQMEEPASPVPENPPKPSNLKRLSAILDNKLDSAKPDSLFQPPTQDYFSQKDIKSSSHSEKNTKDLDTYQTEKNPKNEHQNELIKNFIKEIPHISPKPVPNNQNPSSTASPLEEEEFLTETLAKIYIKQKHFDKALNIFKRLSLKYPEKSTYFAEHVRRIEELVNNNKR